MADTAGQARTPSPLHPLTASATLGASSGSALGANPIPSQPEAGLEVQGLVKYFAGVQAVNGVDFQVRPGECVALIGPNGAGKSTTFACIAGQHRPSAGQVRWNGQPLDGLSPVQRLQRGVARSFQVAQVFEALTVLQNLQLLLPGAAPCDPWTPVDQPALRQTAERLLAQVGLAGQGGAAAHQLAYGAKKRLELAMALAGLEPSAPGAPSALGTPGAPLAPGASGAPGGPGRAPAQLLLLDEPAAGLGSAERAALMQLVQALARDPARHAPLAVLYTEHNMDAVFGVADRVLVLMEGRLVAQGLPADIAQNPLVRSRYLGQAGLAWAGAQHA